MSSLASKEDYNKTASKYSTKSVAKLRFSDTGFDNYVVVVDDELVVRFARNDEAQAYQKLEVGVLNFLKDKKPPVAIPEIVDDKTDEGYMVYKLIPGKILKDSDIAQFDEKDQQQIGRQLAEFVVWLNNSISMHDLKSIGALPGVKSNETWAEELEREIPKFTDNEKPTLTRVTQNLWQEFKSFYPNGITIDRVVHNDLYASNLVIGPDNTIVGVIDFGDIGLGDIYCELKDTFLMGETVMNASLSRYEQLTGQKLEPRLITLWSKLIEIRHIWKENYKVDHVDTYQQSLSHLKEWFPNENWREL